MSEQTHKSDVTTAWRVRRSSGKKKASFRRPSERTRACPSFLEQGFLRCPSPSNGPWLPPDTKRKAETTFSPLWRQKTASRPWPARGCLPLVIFFLSFFSWRLLADPQKCTEFPDFNPKLRRRHPRPSISSTSFSSVRQALTGVCHQAPAAAPSAPFWT